MRERKQRLSSCRIIPAWRGGCTRAGSLSGSADEKGGGRLTQAQPGDVGGIFESGGHGHGVQCTNWTDPQAGGWHGHTVVIRASIYTYMNVGALH